MRDYVNEVLEQMNDKYIAEAADFQAEKRSICPRVVAVALIVLVIWRKKNQKTKGIDSGKEELK